MPETWFTSDLHFGHTNIIGYCNRPYRDVDEMNEMLVHNWNSMVLPDDTVYMVGDFAMGRIDDTLPYARRLLGHKKLVCGNHDRPWEGNHMSPTKRDEWVLRYHEAGFETVVTGMWLEIEGLRICHFPYTGDSHEEDRFKDYRPKDDGTILLCGHVHDAWKTSRTAKGTLQVNVGVDVWNYRPVNARTIEEIIFSD